MTDDLTGKAQGVLSRLTPPRRHRLARMLQIEQIYTLAEARWIPEGSSAWKMAKALREGELIQTGPCGGYVLTPLGARVAQIYEEARTKAAKT